MSVYRKCGTLTSSDTNLLWLGRSCQQRGKNIAPKILQRVPVSAHIKEASMSRGALFWLLLSVVIYVSVAAKLSKNPLFKTEEDESKRCTCNNNNNNNNNNQWLNEATGHFMYECTGRHSIHVIASEYEQQYRDRRWRMSCGYNKAVKECAWTAYINGWDKPLIFECGQNGFITGIESVYRKANYDRKFRFKCCLAHDYETKDCITSAFVNAWKMPFETVIPRDKKYHLVGMYSIHENKFQDRRWRFKFCQLSYKHNKKR